MREEQGMSIIVKRITRITVSLIFLFGLYIMLHGHLTPGGGFAGGVIMALSFIHVVLAFGREGTVKIVSKKASSILESLGAIAFLGIAFLGLIAGGYFFLNFLPKGRPFELFSAGIIPLCNIAIFIKVGIGLFSIFIVLATFRLFGDDNDRGKG